MQYLGPYSNIEYPKIKEIVNEAKGTLGKYTRENWVDISYESRVTYSIGGQTKTEATMSRSILYDFIEPYIHVK